MDNKSHAANGGPLLGQGVVVIWNDIDAAGRDVFYEWHDKEHLPERLAIPGFRRGRRYRCADHSPEWLTLYEADNLDVLTSEAYLSRLNAPTSATTQALTFFRNTSRSVCRIGKTLGSSTGGHVLALRLDIQAPVGADADLECYLTHDVLPAALSRLNVVAASALRTDQASFLNTAESRTREFDVPSWIVLIEATTAEAATEARALIDDATLKRLGAAVRSDAAVYSLEICRLAHFL